MDHLSINNKSIQVESTATKHFLDAASLNIKCLHTDIYKHLDVRNGDSRLNTSHQAELSPLRLCQFFSFTSS